MSEALHTPDSEAPFQAHRVSEHVYWVGAIDWRLRNFHGYTTHRGTTYNAYLIMDEKITLVDTVKKPFKDELIARIASVIDPRKIDYIISNHSEMDHTGCLPEMIELCKPEKVFASPMGVKGLTDHFHLAQELTTVKDGEKVDLGDMHLTFYETRMLHWPDSMFSYLANDGILFSNDAFGMHLATSERFDDEVDDSIMAWETKTYYANIILPYSNLVTKLLDKIGTLNLDIQMIAPDHGPIWRKDYQRVLNWYGQWAEQKRTNSAIIVYDTMWESTTKMAYAISEGLIDAGTSVKMMQMSANQRSDVATEILDTGALLVGSPTLNNNIYPTLADVLTYLKGLRPLNLVGAAFGSYGWGGESIAQLKEILESMKVDVVGDLKVKYVPTDDDLRQCYALGKAVAAKVQERASR